MRQNRLMLVMVIALTLGLASFAAAQMMGGDHDHSSMNKDDSTAHFGMMGEGMMMKMGNMMGDMSKHCKMMSSEFDDLQSHFEKMMKMDDMKALKAEMQKHHDMMTQMHENMSEQRSMCQNMMSLTHSGGMPGMMGADSAKSEADGQHNHDH
ncbi:MAG: hypothetical protein RBT76_07485 [candidate division Zixibacteria bacterium]|nr:hypothetical protein [candidate division Zixibacteria bacterium]